MIINSTYEPTEHGRMREAFDDSIRQNPLDASKHLIYADYLEESGLPELAEHRRAIGLALQAGPSDTLKRFIVDKKAGKPIAKWPQLLRDQYGGRFDPAPYSRLFIKPIPVKSTERGWNSGHHMAKLAQRNSSIPFAGGKGSRKPFANSARRAVEHAKLASQKAKERNWGMAALHSEAAARYHMDSADQMQDYYGHDQEGVTNAAAGHRLAALGHLLTAAHLRARIIRGLQSRT